MLKTLAVRGWTAVRGWYEDGIGMANPLPVHYLHVRGAVVGVDPLSDGLRMCACHLDNIFRSGNTYISERQYIYFRAAIHISE